MQFLSRDLTNQFISTSYQDVVQRCLTGSVDYLLDGLGYTILGVPLSSVGGIVLTQDQTASLSSTSSYVGGYNVDGPVFQSISTSYIEGYNVDGPVLESLVSLVSSQSITTSYIKGYNVDGIVSSSSFSNTSSYALNISPTDTASYSLTSSWAINSISASHALQADSASWALTASFALNGGSTITDIDGGNASSNYGGVIQSPIFGGNA